MFLSCILLRTIFGSGRNRREHFYISIFHSDFISADIENGQRGLDPEQMQQQQLKLWERQRFFEEVFQHDVDFFFPVSHLQIEHRRRKFKCQVHRPYMGILYHQVPVFYSKSLFVTLYSNCSTTVFQQEGSFFPP